MPFVDPSSLSPGVETVVHSSKPTLSPETSIRHPSTVAIHADDQLNRSTDVSPALHVSTTFRYASNPNDLVPAKDVKVSSLVASTAAPHRLNHPLQFQDS